MPRDSGHPPPDRRHAMEISFIVPLVMELVIVFAGLMMVPSISI